MLEASPNIRFSNSSPQASRPAKPHSHSPLSHASNDLIAQLQQALFTPASGTCNENARRELLLQVAGLEEENQITTFIEGAITLCRQLYEAGRSFDAIPVARTAYALAARQANVDLKQRIATAYGVVLADEGNYAGAIEHHATALKFAQQIKDKDGIARAWNSLGMTFFYAGSYGFAADAILCAVKQLRHSPQGTFPLFILYTNLAHCYLHLLEIKAGISIARKAMKMETPDMIRADPLSAALLRRSYVRLLILANKAQDAGPWVDEIILLAQTHPTPRIEIAALVTRGAYEVACGEADIGLTRLRQALQRARAHPVALHDTLTCLMQAEEAAGHPDRAAFYLNELADSIHREVIGQARRHIEISEGYNDDHQVALDLIEDSRKRLRPWCYPAPAEWLTLDRLAVTAGLKRDGRAWHGPRVGELTRLLALASGCDATLAMDMGFAAELHDIGMMALPNTLLSKPGIWSPEERTLMAGHCKAGVDILAGISHPRALIAMDIALYHHEWWNGAGYPHGIAGEAIPKAARLCAIADVFDALLSHRSHRDGLNLPRAIEKLQARAGNQLDPHLVACFLDKLKDGAIEKFVRTEMCHLPTPAYDIDTLIERFSHGRA